MVELINSSLRVRLARQRYAMAGRQRLRDYDWERGVWKTPEPLQPRLRDSSRMFGASLAFLATVLIGLGLTNIPVLGQTASGLMQQLMAPMSANISTCESGGAGPGGD